MNVFKLLPLIALCPLSVAATHPAVPQRVKVHQVTTSASKPLPLQAVKTVNPALATYRAPEASLSESFEYADKQFPSTWTTNLTNPNDWMIYIPGSLGISTTDGYYAAMGTCLTLPDENGNYVPQLHDASWLITPEVKVEDGQQLMFDLYFDVRSLYVWTVSGDDKTVDEEDGMILKRENAENMKICISVDGGEWIVLKDLWDEYGKLGYYDILYDYELPEFREFTFSLEPYKGKNVKFGFCHSYLNPKGGYGMFLDNVKVQLPPVKASYSLPLGTLFWGMSNDMLAMQSWALAPYFTNQEWINETIADGASYNWSYRASADDSNNPTVSTDSRDFTTYFEPDYSTNPDAFYNAYTFPTLTATMPNGVTGEYTYANGDGFLFAGILASLPTRDGGFLDFGLSTFDQADDVQIYNADFSIPAWGKTAMTKDWWTNHYFRGEPGEGDYAMVTSNINFFYSNGAPLVITGLREAASLECDDDAEFKLELIALNDDFTTGDVIATSILKGSDVLKIDNSIAQFPNSVMMNFTFDKPVVVEGINFIAKISGFNSDKVKSYAPLQSYKSAPLCYGFSTVEFCAVSLDQPEPVEAMVPTAALGDSYNSFAMYLDAYYPFLKCEENEFTATEGNAEKTFAFNSSYPAQDLTVADADGKLPSWLEVTKSGNLGSTAVTVKVIENAPTPETVSLFVKAPGVSHELKITQGKGAGIELVNSSSVTDMHYFDVYGRRLSVEPTEGVYIVRKYYADGNVVTEKVIK